MAKDMTLYWAPGSPPCWRIMIALEEKGLQGYNSRELDFLKEDHKGPEVMKINPRGQLPAFKHGDIILNESMGVCEYLEATFKGQGTPLVPDDLADKAQMYQRMHEVNTLSNKVGEILYYNYYVPEGERLDSAVKRRKEALTTELKLWEGYLSKGPFLAGKTFTLADVVGFPSIYYFFKNGVSEKKYPKLAAYYNTLKERPSIKTSWPKNLPSFPGLMCLEEC